MLHNGGRFLDDAREIKAENKLTQTEKKKYSSGAKRLL